MSNSEKKSCPICDFCKNASCGVKLIIAIIVVALIVICTVFCVKKSCNEEKLNKAIQAWVDKNPRAILDSVQKYAEQQQREAEQRRAQDSSKAVKENIKQIRDEKNTGVVNPKGTKVIVEFYDYNCGYCKMASKAVKEVAQDANVKVIYRDFPILSEASTVAARYSVAVAMTEPAKFGAFHNNLIEGSARSTDDVRQALKQSNISVDKIEKVLKNKEAEINKRLEDNRNLAIKLGLQGTPAFVIGEELIPGYIDANQIKNMLK